ncbi:endonuclease/exonuclease/phosphatase family protein [Euphorbia peplus]|nr:endonuclease/exonuclease/phosphatase family protein [Euphorbia peplus]
MSWPCKKCTFINPPSSKLTCELCQSPSSPNHPSPSSSSVSLSSSPSNVPKWSCKSCTFLNPYKNTSCEICGTRASSGSSLSCFDVGEDEALDSAVGSVFQPLKSCKRKIGDLVDDGRGVVQLGSFNGAKDGGSKHGTKLGGFQGFGASNKAVTVLKEDTNSPAVSNSFKILSYNVWFREDLELQKRMKAIGDLIQLHSPEVICFQEVTPNIYDIFQRSGWWKTYSCSVSDELKDSRPYFCMLLSKVPVKSFKTMSFENSIMGRELCISELELLPNKPMVIATSHLESPCPAPPTWNQMFSKERVEQAKKATNFLKQNQNVIFCGDMNWDDKLDGNFPLPEGWTDAWGELKPGDNGWTYDTKSNLMLSGNRNLQKRLDRFVCNLKDFRIDQIDMIGKEAIPGLSHVKEKKVRQEIKRLELPVLPSDHYGLLLTISGL